MSLNDLGNIFAFIGGIGMFLYGMNIMADGLQKSAGNKMKQLLGYLTNSRIMGVLIGALITAIIQSSGATTVMVVGFVNAGVLTLTQAVGVIMGANIGTTITAWIVSMGQLGDQFGALKPSFYAPFIIGVGAVFIVFTKSQKKKNIGEIFIGLGFLFIGLDFMSSSVSPYTELPIFSEAFKALGNNPILGILIGALVTAILQSSSASVGILQSLASTGIVTTNAAIYITLGQNIGSCCTALLSSVGANKTAKRAALIHLMFNIIGTIIFGGLFFILFTVDKQMAASNISQIQISIFHTIFNVGNTLILFPFAKQLVKISNVIIKGEDEEAVDEEEVTLRHLDDRIFEQPSFAVENAVMEVVHMGRIVSENISNALRLVNEDDANEEEVAKVLSTEKTVNSLAKMITEYLIKISNLSLTEKQHLVVNNLFYTVNDIERVGDHAENIVEFTKYKKERNVSFSKVAHDELKEICDICDKCFSAAIDARETEGTEYIRLVVKLEDVVDSLEEDLRERHIERLSKSLCQPEAGVAFLDIISNIERVSDHASNIVLYVKDERDA